MLWTLKHVQETLARRMGFVWGDVLVHRGGWPRRNRDVICLRRGIMGDNRDVSGWRKEYRRGELDPMRLTGDPVGIFVAWLDEARKAGVVEPNAMCLATVEKESEAPSARIVLLKEVDQRGFVWFTNYRSRKGRHLDQVPKAAAVFWWSELERQVRIEGPVDKISEEESDAYFQSRPKGSRLGAWVSDQSQVVETREELEAKWEKLQSEYPGDAPVPRPSHWGGYRLTPLLIEFWQGRESRLHDRIQFLREGQDQEWKISRLQP